MGSTQTNILLYFILLKEIIKKVEMPQLSLPILVGLWSLQIGGMLLFLLWKC